MSRIGALARVSVAFVGLCWLSLPGEARGQAANCQSSWLPTFGTLPVDGTVNALAVLDDGSGPALYAGGSFTTAAGSVAASNIAKWDGTAWSALGSGVNAAVLALAVFDDGNGPALYVGGTFATAGVVSAANVARWNGTSWSALGTGTDDSVLSLLAFDDGSGPALCAGGRFTTAGGVAMNHVGKWNGTVWSALGSGMTEGGGQGTFIKTLAVFDDGGGSKLYAGGAYTKADGVVALHIARWNGSSWSPLAFGLNKQVWALTAFDDGSGPALYAGGTFTSSGGMPANTIARWDGTNWSAMGAGMDTSVNALAVFDDGDGPALYAGGAFITSPAGDGHLAKWGGCSVPPTPWTDLGSGLAGVAGIPPLTGAGDLVAGTPGSLALANAAPSAPALLFISTSSTPTPFKGGTLLPVPILLALPLSTNPLGNMLLPWTAWPAGLSGASLFFQFGIKDLAAVNGVALSNALRADVP